jgi:hypothetical protein
MFVIANPGHVAFPHHLKISKMPGGRWASVEYAG